MNEIHASIVVCQNRLRPEASAPTNLKMAVHQDSATRSHCLNFYTLEQVCINFPTQHTDTYIYIYYILARYRVSKILGIGRICGPSDVVVFFFCVCLLDDSDHQVTRGVSQVLDQR